MFLFIQDGVTTVVRHACIEKQYQVAEVLVCQSRKDRELKDIKSWTLKEKLADFVVSSDLFPFIH